jgi:hypothetical protein
LSLDCGDRGLLLRSMAWSLVGGGRDLIALSWTISPSDAELYAMLIRLVQCVMACLGAESSRQARNRTGRHGIEQSRQVDRQAQSMRKATLSLVRGPCFQVLIVIMELAWSRSCFQLSHSRTRFVVPLCSPLELLYPTCSPLVLESCHASLLWW